MALTKKGNKPKPNGKANVKPNGSGKPNGKGMPFIPLPEPKPGGAATAMLPKAIKDQINFAVAKAVQCLNTKWYKRSKTGRARRIVDWDVVYELCRIGCPQDEIARVIGVSLPCLLSHPQWEDAWEMGRAAGRSAIRMEQYRIALDSHHDKQVSMLIWVGKQLLGQKEQVLAEHTGDIKLRPAQHNLKNLSYEELLQLRGIIEKTQQRKLPEPGATVVEAEAKSLQ